MAQSDINLSEVLERSGANTVTLPVMHHIGSIEYAISSVLRQTINLNEGEQIDVDPVAIIGTMRAGKTFCAISIANKISESGLKTYFYSLTDNRGRHFNRNGLGLNPNVINGQVEKDSNAITGFIERINCGEIESGSVLFLSEKQFANDFGDKAEELISVARSKGVKIVFDCLYRFFRGDLVPSTQRLLANICTNSVYSMVSIDCFDQTREAEVPARFLRFYEDGSSINGDIDNSTFYKGLSREDILSMIYQIKNNQSLKGKLCRTDEMGRIYYLLPAHCSDKDVVLGGDEIYLPTSIDTLQGIVSVVTEELPDIREKMQYSVEVTKNNYYMVEA